ncbi:hypothetical protein AMTRI_Chr10g230320 [Amborella trichopoda]
MEFLVLLLFDILLIFVSFSNFSCCMNSLDNETGDESLAGTLLYRMERTDFVFVNSSVNVSEKASACCGFFH